MQARILLSFYIAIIVMAVPTSTEDGCKTPDLIYGIPFDQWVDTATRSEVITRLLQTPLHFIANQGQMDESVSYYARSDGATIYCTDQGITFGFSKGSVSLKFSNGRRVRPEARAELPGKVNYFIGSDPASWQVNVPTFREIVYPSVYPGVDLVYSGDQRRLKYTFYIQPGTDPGQVQMIYEDAQDIRVDEATGELAIQTERGEIRDIAPVAYQKINGGKRNIDMRFRVKDGAVVEFVIGDYDKDHALVLDPTYTNLKI